MRETTITLLLIRHGTTRGNLEKRYIGAGTDEPLCADGVRALEAAAASGLFGRWNRRDYRLFVSPMRRCRQTAAILFPGVSYDVVDDLRETDFGEFDGRSHDELDGDPRYQRWIDSGGTIAFPGGEAPDAFAQRSRRALDSILRRVTDDAHDASGTGDAVPCALRAAIVTHGGNIMAMMSALTGKGFYDFHIPTGNGFLVELCVESDVGACADSRAAVPALRIRALAFKRLDAPPVERNPIKTRLTTNDAGDSK